MRLLKVTQDRRQQAVAPPIAALIPTTILFAGVTFFGVVRIRSNETPWPRNLLRGLNFALRSFLARCIIISPYIRLKRQPWESQNRNRTG
jgi:hypothetical protein